MLVNKNTGCEITYVFKDVKILIVRDDYRKQVAKIKLEKVINSREYYVTDENHLPTTFAGRAAFYGGAL